VVDVKHIKHSNKSWNREDPQPSF